MKRRWLLKGTAASAAAAGWLAWRPAAAAPAQPGQPVDWPTVQLLDGSALGAAAWQGRVGVVVFWSLTCGFCRRHNQHLEKLHRAALAQRLPMPVLGVVHERDPVAVARHVQQQGYSFPQTLDLVPLAAALTQRRMTPITAVVNRQGRMQTVWPGEMFEDDVMQLLQLARPA